MQAAGSRAAGGDVIEVVKVWGRVIGPGGGCGAGRARESRCYREALLGELVCGMRMEGAHRHERKVGACE